MDPKNFQILLIISFCSLILFNPAHAECVPRTSDYFYPSPLTSSPPNAAPVSAPIPSLRSQPIPSSPPNAASPTSHISAPTPSANPPSESAPVPYPQPGMLKRSPSSPDSAPSSTANPDLKKICDSTDYPSVCLASITPFFAGKIDPISALEMAINAASAHTKLALVAATRLAIAPTTSPSVASILADCRDSYDDALDNFQSALDSIPTRDIGTINSMLSAAVTDYVTCDDGFTGGVSLMADFSDKLTKMGSNCLAIASLLKW